MTFVRLTADDGRTLHFDFSGQPSTAPEEGRLMNAVTSLALSLGFEVSAVEFSDEPFPTEGDE